MTGGALGLTTNLISLERGEGELLLVNAFHMRPLHVKRGREKVKRLLADMAAHGGTAESCAAAFAADAALLRLFLDHHILVDGPEVPGEASVSPPKTRMTLYLLLGESCNLDCVYCLDGPATYERHGRGEMSPEVAFRSVERCLGEVVPGGSVEVAFFGGEPLLHWPLVKRTIRHCEEVLKPAHPDKRIHYHLTSNLTLSPPDLVEWVMRYDITIVCGVDGPPDIQDRCRVNRGGGPTHARTAATVRRLVEAGARVTLRATIHSANHDRLAEVAEHHAALGAVSSLFVPVRPTNSDRDIFPENLLPDPDRIVAAARNLGRGARDASVPEAEPYKANLFPFNDFTTEIRPGVRNVVACGAPHGTTFVVRPNGDVYPCIYLVGQERYRLGGVDAGLSRRPLDDMMTAFHVDNREDCRGCAWRYACGGGCPVMSLARDGAAEAGSKVDEYCRKVTCGLSRALLGDMLWALADSS